MKTLWFAVTALLLFVLIGAPNAHADSYTPTFSCTTPSGSDFGCYFIPDGYTAPDVSFSSPMVQATVSSSLNTFIDANPQLYDVTLPATDSPTDSYTYQFGEFGNGTFPPLNTFGVLTISDLTTGTMDMTSVFLGNFVPPSVIGEGTLTFSPVSAAAPEPAPILLLFFGAGLILLMRKRFVARLPQTA